MAGSVLFTVDLEEFWESAELMEPTRRLGELTRIFRFEEPMKWLLEQLRKFKIKAIFYISGTLAEQYPAFIKYLKQEGHVLGSHGYYHRRGESAYDYSDMKARMVLFKATNDITYMYPYRSPYWSTTPMPGWSGGFFLRALPYFWLKREVQKSGVLWLHPHDLDTETPRLKNPLLNWKRHVGLSTVRSKLMRLIKEVEWRCP